MSKLFAGWSGSARSFVNQNRSELCQRLTQYTLAEFVLQAGESQERAWLSSISQMQNALSSLTLGHPDAADWNIVIEYQIPRERGRRPDFVVLLPGHALVLEFKAATYIDPAHVDQVACYARDLANYHESSHNLKVVPILVTDCDYTPICYGDVRVINSKQISSLLSEFATISGQAPSAAEWIAGDYAPLPSLVSAARHIFRHETLPAIKQAHSAGIPEALNYLQDIVLKAKREGSRHLILVTGVPGSGKTLLGLQHVYADHFSEGDQSKNAVLLSGNTPLIAVLQDALRSSVFVQDVHGFLQQYSRSSNRTPKEKVFVFDEAQRAWDQGKVRERRPDGLSEPEDFIRIGDSLDGWSVMIGLIGEGQEIYNGEESGLQQWDNAIQKYGPAWTVHCSTTIASKFKNKRLETTDSLNLDRSLRSHLASDLHSWVRLLLDAEIENSIACSTSLESAGYNLYCTRNLDSATAYVRERYGSELDKRYGLLASSKAGKLLESMGLRVPPVKFFRHGKWFNAETSDINSSCSLKSAASEFNCQGLELDLPILVWGQDLTWYNNTWTSPRPRANNKAKDPHRLRLNSYRVLLTRGRDGMIIHVPPG